MNFKRIYLVVWPLLAACSSPQVAVPNQSGQSEFSLAVLPASLTQGSAEVTLHRPIPLNMPLTSNAKPEI